MKENGDIKTNETSMEAGRVPSPEIGPKIILPGLTVTSHGATERGVTRRENPNMYRRPMPSLTAQQPWQVGAGGEITTFKPEPTASLHTDTGDKDSNRAGSVAGIGLQNCLMRLSLRSDAMAANHLTINDETAHNKLHSVCMNENVNKSTFNIDECFPYLY